MFAKRRIKLVLLRAERLRSQDRRKSKSPVSIIRDALAPCAELRRGYERGRHVHDIMKHRC